ncbi:MAG: ATP-binding cassette domain-containing protein [Beijerinckiaceae bacterium]|nr:ATP-binding cassette domain-containing protein [Beijerinckiaceae bacterium]
MHGMPSILPLQVEGLTLNRDGKRLLDGVGFALPRGGVTALIGPNGAGKSLTLRLCHGLILPDGGTIGWAIGSGRIAGRPRHALVFQRPVMLRRSVRANLVHALRALDFDQPEHRAGAALARYGLADLAERPARLLSGGEQQRLAIARAWALEPELLMLDEPSAHLDPGATRQIEQIIAGLAAEGVTILMTTHDLGQVRRLANRVLFLHAGRLKEDAPAEQFLRAPASPEARAFLAGDLLW